MTKFLANGSSRCRPLAEKSLPTFRLDAQLIPMLPYCATSVSNPKPKLFLDKVPSSSIDSIITVSSLRRALRGYFRVSQDLPSLDPLSRISEVGSHASSREGGENGRYVKHVK